MGTAAVRTSVSLGTADSAVARTGTLAVGTWTGTLAVGETAAGGSLTVSNSRRKCWQEQQLCRALRSCDPYLDIS